jgi:carbonic anhydrase
MLSKSFLLSISALLSLALSTTSAHPLNSRSPFPAPKYGSGSYLSRRSEDIEINAVDGASFPDIQKLIAGNKKFQKDIEDKAPGLLKALTDKGQSPPFMYIGCSDSRVSENTIFSSLPGTLFVQRNIANQYITGDPNSESSVAYSIKVLGIQHVIVLGHYGCGGVAAAIASPPSAPIDATDNIVQAWIQPIRDLFETSDRKEIVELRK